MIFKSIETDFTQPILKEYIEISILFLAKCKKFYN